jgi:hypothetical protein
MSSLTDMKVGQLKKIASTSCIKGYSKMNKANLIVAIKAHKLPIPKVAKAPKVKKAKAPKASNAPPSAPSKKDKARSRIRALLPGLATAMAKDVNLGGRPKKIAVAKAVKAPVGIGYAGGVRGPALGAAEKKGLAKLGVIF